MTDEGGMAVAAFLLILAPIIAIYTVFGLVWLIFHVVIWVKTGVRRLLR